MRIYYKVYTNLKSGDDFYDSLNHALGCVLQHYYLTFEFSTIKKINIWELPFFSFFLFFFGYFSWLQINFTLMINLSQKYLNSTIKIIKIIFKYS